MKKWIIWIVVIAVIVVAVMALKKKGTNNLPIDNTVKSIEVEKGEIVIKLEETGEIQPIREIDIKTKIGGKVTKFFVDENDYVKAGDVIAHIEPTYEQSAQITNIKNNLRSAEIRLKRAEEDVQNSRGLFEKNYISQRELDDAEDEFIQANLDHDKWVEQNQLIEDIETEGTIAKVVATASGTVIDKLVEVGEMVRSDIGSYSEGTVIVKLADLTNMIVSSSINEVDIAKIHKDQEVSIQVDAFPYKSYKGRITKISASAVESNNVKVFDIEISILDSDDHLKPGMTANVTIIGETKSDIVTIPIRAIFNNTDGQDIVYKVESDTISGEVIVKTGINDFQKVEIISGLEVGDKISLSAPPKPEDEEEVRLD